MLAPVERPSLAPVRPAMPPWPTARIVDRVRRLLARSVPVALVLLTLAACLVRTGGLPSAPGTMRRDESRLALAARAILERGAPVLPGGFVYTRGLLPQSLEAASFWVLGTSDRAARLPSLIAGTLLVPAVYLLARGVGGSGPSLAASAIVAFSPPLVLQSREAWLYSWFVLWFVLALAWLQRAHTWRRMEYRAGAGLAFTLSLLSHEFAILFVPIAGLAELVRLRVARVRWRQALVFWTIVLTAVALVGGLSLLLRAPTAAGATVEMREYLRPSLELGGLSTPFRMLGGWHPWLLPAAALGLGLPSRRAWRALARRAPTGARSPVLVYLALGLVLLFVGLVLSRRGHPRDLLLVVPLLAVAATYGASRVGPRVLAALVGRRLSAGARAAVGGTLVLALTVGSVDPGRLREDAREQDVATTWLQGLADRGPDDLIMTYATTPTMHYLGRTDFWLRPVAYAKYVWAGQPPFRDVHTGALVIRGGRELEELVIAPHGGRTLWLIMDQDTAAERSRGVQEVNERLASFVPERRVLGDGHVVLRVQL